MSTATVKRYVVSRTPYCLNVQDTHCGVVVRVSVYRSCRALAILCTVHTLLGRMVHLPQGRYQYTGRHKNQTNTVALSPQANYTD
jgi:hypothetical protein